MSAGAPSGAPSGAHGGGRGGARRQPPQANRATANIDTVLAVDWSSIATLAIFDVIGTAVASFQADYPHRSPDLLAYVLAAGSP